MPIPNIVPALRQRTLLRSAVLLAGAAVAAAEAAWLHMRELAQTYGVICGSGAGVTAHCPACYASVSLFASALALLVLAQADRPTALRARSNPSA